jgi:hypothetical protein
MRCACLEWIAQEGRRVVLRYIGRVGHACNFSFPDDQSERFVVLESGLALDVRPQAPQSHDCSMMP